MRTPNFDPGLWFMHRGCRGRHYLLGNPHTVPGRMWAWCPHEGCTHFVALADMGRRSQASKYWIAGYLHGSEPPPPAGPDGPPDFDAPEYRRWRSGARRFRRTGSWRK